MFREGWGEEALNFAPEAIAAPLGQLDQLVRTHIPSLRRAVIVLGRHGDPRLPEADRERLWQAFRVPIFEQIIGRDGKLLATECEAHQGIHVESERLAVNLQDLDPSPCACGRKTPRLMEAATREEPTRRAAASTG